MNKQFDLLIDTKRTGFNTVRGLKEGDNNAILNITLVQNSIPFDLTDLTVRINYKRPDNKIFLQMADIVDVTEGKIKVNILTKALENVGEIKADLSVFDKDNRKITSTTFSMFVDSSVYRNDYMEQEDLDLIQDIYSKEKERQSNEISRLREEARRVKSELNRQELEKRREIKEKERQENDTERQSNEDKRLKNEDERIRNELNRVGSEQIRFNSENKRQENEIGRVQAETTREANEKARQENEIKREKKHVFLKETISNINKIEQYNTEKEYKKLNRVTYNGSSYECLKDCTGVEPVNVEHWICIAHKGKDGDGAGDMVKSIYDKNNNGIVDKAEEAMSVKWNNVKNVNKFKMLQQGYDLNDLIKPGLYIGQMLQNSPEEFNMNLIEVIKPDDMDIVMQRVSKVINHAVLTRVYKDGNWSKWTTYLVSVNGKTGEVELKAEDIKTNSGETVELQLKDMTQQIENIDLSADKVTLDNTKLKSKNVKDGIEELFTFADNGKKNWVDVIGSPLSTGDSFSTLKDKTQDLKSIFVYNLWNKKVSVSGTEGLGSLIDKIKNIDTGLKVATGALQLDTNMNGLTVKNLSFKPFLVCGISDAYDRAYTPCFFYIRKYGIKIEQIRESRYSGASGYEPIYSWLNIDIYNDGFYAKLDDRQNYFKERNITWVAVGE